MEFSSFILVANCFSIAILLSRYRGAQLLHAGPRWFSLSPSEGERERERGPSLQTSVMGSPHGSSHAHRDHESQRENGPLTPALSPSEGERENRRQRSYIGRFMGRWLHSWLARSARPLLLTAFILWAVACAAGLALLTSRAWQIDIPERQFYSRCHLQYTRAFIATDDVRVLDHKPKPQLPLFEFQEDPHAPPLPHVGEKLAEALRNPRIREILPACVRPPLEVRPNQEATRGFVPNGFRLARREPPTEVSWGSWSPQGPAATGTFESLPIRKSRLPYLEISVAGDLGEKNLSLDLVDTATGRRIPVRPSGTPGNKWLNCYVKAPAGEFRIVARDDSQTAWFAFKAPRELGRLSMWSLRVLNAWKYLLFAGLGLLVFNLSMLRAPRRSADL